MGSLAAPHTVSAESDAPGSPVNFSDRFFSDTRNDYRLMGSVAWEAGKMKLPASSVLLRVEPLLPKLQIEAHLWPTAGEGPEETSATRIGIPTTNSWEVVLVILRQRRQGQLYRQVLFVEANNGQTPDRLEQEVATTQLGQTPAFTFLGDVERWQIDYDNGLIKVSCNGQQIGQAYSEAFSSWVLGVSVQQHSGAAELTQLNLVGNRSGYTAEERKGYEETIRLRLEAESRLAQGDLHGAIHIEQSRIPVMERTFGKDDYTLGLVYQWMGDVYSSADYHKEAIESYQRAAAINRRVFGSQHPQTLLSQASSVYQDAMAGNLEQAEQAYRSLAKSIAEVCGPGSTSTQAVFAKFANILVMKSIEEYDQGQYSEYAQTLQESLELHSAKLRPDAWVILKFQRAYDWAQTLASADPKQKERLIRWQKQVQDVNREMDKGDQRAALVSLKRSLAESRKLFGEKHVQTIETMAATGRCAGNCGDPGLAVSLQEHVLEYWRKNGAENDYALVDAMVALAETYSGTDRYGEAEKLLKDAVDICHTAKQEVSDSYANCLLARGRLQIVTGDTRAARASLEEALGVYQRTGDPAGESAIITRERLADLCRAENDLAGAERYLEQQRSLVLSRYGKHSLPYIDVLRSEAVHFVMRSEFSRAVERYETALQLVEATYGKDSRMYQSTLEGLIKARSWQGDDAQASREFLQWVDLQQKQQQSLFNVYPERLQFSRVSLDRGMLSSVLELAVARQITAKEAYQRVLNAKGAVTARQRALRVAAKDPTSSKLVAELRALNSQVASALVQQPSDEQRATIKSLLAQKEQIESQLAQRGSERIAAKWQLSVEEVRQRLPADTVLIDYVEYDRRPGFVESLLGNDSVLAMMAFVVTRDREVELVDLGNVIPVDRALVEWLAALELEPRIANDEDVPKMAKLVDERGALVRKLVWDPLVSKIGEAETVVISPDGWLVNCPFAALPTDDGKGFLINEKTLAYAIAARLLPEQSANGDAAQIKDPRFLAIDGVDYGKPAGGDPNALVPFLPVPFDADEVQSLRDAFRRRYPEGKSAQLTGNEAREELFKLVAAKAHYIHLVTHGFCVAASDIHLTPPNIQDSTSSDLGPEANSLEADPLVAGIAFAGANRSTTTSDTEDGVLWTDEISSLDLHQADLVVMFACQSTVGGYAPGEGMLGCQRALHVAGAKSSVGTLWSIEVDATREFMKLFYSNYWDQKLGKADALRATMEHMIWEYPQKRGADKDHRLSVRCPPALWAGFVLSGDWR